jgi:hypothetical protein
MIYLAIIIFYVALAVSFVIKEKTLGLISSMGLMLVGIYTASEGIASFNNLMTQTFSVITIAIGAYFLISGSLNIIEESVA